MFDLVKTTTADGLILNGLFSKPLKNKHVVLHTHGYSQDFFQNPFILSIANSLRLKGVGFLSIQTRGSGTHLRVYTTKKSSRDCGAKFELLEEAYLDLDAWINFLANKDIEKIVLQGHSLGSIKVIRYLFESSNNLKKNVKKLILLSPYDKNYLIKDFTKGKVGQYLKIAKSKIDSGLGLEIIPDSFDKVPSTFGTYYSFYAPGDLSDIFSFHLTDYNFQILSQIELPTLMLVGKLDPYFHPSDLNHPSKALEILRSKISDFKGELIDDCKHRFLGKEQVIAEKIAGFVT